MENNEIDNKYSRKIYIGSKISDWKWYFEFYYAHVSSLVYMGMKQCL